MNYKFRAFDPETKQYIYVASIDFVHNIADGLPFNMQEGQDSIIIHNPHLEQYTGAKDCEGKEVYVGDILQLQCGSDANFYCYVGLQRPFSICWYPENFSAKVRGRAYEIGLPGNISELWKVIGNHAQNIDLMREHFWGDQ